MTVCDPEYGGRYAVKVALVVAIYGYGLYYDLDTVFFRSILYFSSYAQEGYTPVPADCVFFYIDKDQQGSDLNNQAMELEMWDTPVYHQGRNFEQTILRPSDPQQRLPVVGPALEFAVTEVLDPTGIIGFLINTAESFEGEESLDFDMANWTGTPTSWVRWTRPDMFFPPDENPYRQYAFNCFRWRQNNAVNPSSYYGIKVSARITLQAGNPIAPYIDMPPVYLRIYHSYPNNPPNTPSTPSGHSSGFRDISYSYDTVATDPDNDQVCCEFYWDDGTTTTTDWRDSGYSHGAYHAWSAVGIYNVRVHAQDRHGAWSGYSPPITVTIYNQPQGGGGCPTFFVWNGSAYKDFGIIDIHNPEDYDLVKEVPMSPRIVGVQNYIAKILLREGWEGLNFSQSEIDQVKLYAVVNGQRVLCPLIYANHSQLGNIILRLLFSDDWKVDAYLMETIDLRFLVPYQTVQQYVFVIEGRNHLKR